MATNTKRTRAAAHNGRYRVIHSALSIFPEGTTLITHTRESEDGLELQICDSYGDGVALMFRKDGSVASESLVGLVL